MQVDIFEENVKVKVGECTYLTIEKERTDRSFGHLLVSLT